MMFRSALSRMTSGWPALFYALKKADLLLHYVMRRQFEPDFLRFAAASGFPGPLQIVDVGANIGQSALGFARLFPKASITSFEANPDLAGYLGFCRTLIGQRFEYRMVGLSDTIDDVVLFVPRRGAVLIYGEASIDRASLDDPEVAARIGSFDVATQKIKLVPFDGLGLRPDIVKIDVQGHEMSVLRGMVKTIADVAPMFLIERSSADGDVIRTLEPFGYEAFVPVPGGALEPYRDGVSSTNMFCLPTRVAGRSALVDAILR